MEARVKEEEESLLKNVGELFKDVRLSIGLSQRGAAALSLSTQARISYLEKGATDVQLLTLHRFARAYGYELEIHLTPILDPETKEFNDALAEAMAELGSGS